MNQQQKQTSLATAQGSAPSSAPTAVLTTGAQERTGCTNVQPLFGMCCDTGAVQLPPLGAQEPQHHNTCHSHGTWLGPDSALLQ